MIYHLFAQRLGSYSTLTAQDLLAQVTAIRQADNLPTASICKEGHDTSWQGKVLHLAKSLGHALLPQCQWHLGTTDRQAAET